MSKHQSFLGFGSSVQKFVFLILQAAFGLSRRDRSSTIASDIIQIGCVGVMVACVACLVECNAVVLLRSCSAGIGRTGTFCVLDVIMYLLKSDSPVS